jgi:hypothetical protein
MHPRQARQSLRTRADFYKVYYATFVAERQPGYSVPNFGDPPSSRRTGRAVAWLDNTHRELDAAVIAALRLARRITEPDPLARLARRQPRARRCGA